jgi:hypothetical protein
MKIRNKSVKIVQYFLMIIFLLPFCECRKEQNIKLPNTIKPLPAGEFGVSLCMSLEKFLNNYPNIQDFERDNYTSISSPGYIDYSGKIKSFPEIVYVFLSFLEKNRKLVYIEIRYKYEKKVLDKEFETLLKKYSLAYGKPKERSLEYSLKLYCWFDGYRGLSLLYYPEGEYDKSYGCDCNDKKKE